MKTPYTIIYHDCEGTIREAIGCTLTHDHFHCVHDHEFSTQEVLRQAFTSEECEDLPTITARDRALESFAKTPAGMRKTLEICYVLWQRESPTAFDSIIKLAELLGIVMPISRDEWAFVHDEQITFTPEHSEELAIVELIMDLSRSDK